MLFMSLITYVTPTTGIVSTNVAVQLLTPNDLLRILFAKMNKFIQINLLIFSYYQVKYFFVYYFLHN